ncbi:MAG: hypothetical protein EHM43_12550 [Ignavibacteriae bacterium]|nr:MAG: hypothetical protein EHM43_12550 [Ignavibacteriota bacterium]
MTTKQQELIVRFRKAKYDYENTRIGSVRGNRGEATMQRIVDEAERDGWLNELLEALYPATSK